MSMAFDVEKVVTSLSKNRVLTKTAELGLLSRLEKSGFTLTTAVPLLIKADELDLLGVLEASSNKVLPLAATAIDLAPAALPLVKIAINTPAVVLLGGAAASAAAAYAAVSVIPDDSIASVAIQTVLAVTLGVIVPGALTVGGVVLSKLK